jgi:hypothetical protein
MLIFYIIVAILSICFGAGVTYFLMRTPPITPDVVVAAPPAEANMLISNKPVVEKIDVFNRITEREDEKGTFEHVMYSTMQEEANFCRYFIDDQMIGEGSYDVLDSRYCPPYRRVVFVTQETPVLPMKIRAENHISNADGTTTLVGRGDLTMFDTTYHALDDIYVPVVK